MKFTLSWLKAHLATEASAQEIADRLTMLGHEVEAIIDRAAGLQGFTVAEIVAAEPHPNADKLTVCQVETGSGQLQVVCGASNARVGLKGVFAPVGAVIPASGTVLRAATIRGVASAGMLLSEREMCLSDEHVGIVELSADAVVGAPAAEALGLANPVIDVAITPNRSDCLSVRGLARDLAASGFGQLRPLDDQPVPGSFNSPIGVELRLSPETAAACPYFVGRLIQGVRNVASPSWLADRLSAAGLRPISALVDITNYLTLDLARPLHAFDADNLAGQLHVRLARQNERLAALNERTYALDPSMTVIADDVGPAALGGVIGGERTACSAETSRVFLESALFDPVRTATTGRALNILSDARFRFERGIDPHFLVPGIEIATRLILSICGGEASELVVAGEPPPPPPPIRLRPERVCTLTGVAVSPERTATTLRSLGFSIDADAGEGWQVSPPSWRNDIDGEACLVEEVVRIEGYDRIPTTSLERQATLPQPALTPLQRRRRLARRTLAARGLVEAVTLSFLASAEARLFGGTNEALTLVNPISSDLDRMRPSLLPNLIVAAGRNADRGVQDAALFEIGPQYADDTPEGQTIVACAIRTGQRFPRHWAAPARPVDAFDAKGDALALLQALRAPVASISLTTDAPVWFHPGRSGVLRLGPKSILAVFGELHPRVLRALGIKRVVVGCEVFVDRIPLPRASTTARPPLELAPLQPIERDFAFIVGEGVAADALVRAARSADKQRIQDIAVFDVFSGGALEPGQKSVAISVRLQPTEKTLTDPEIDAIGRRIVEAVGNETGAVLRS